MNGILMVFHPVDGVYASIGVSDTDAQSMARKFTLEHYPGVPKFDAWLLFSWHLMEDNQAMFVTPKPWLMASFYMEDHLRKINDGTLPEWIVFIARSPQEYTEHILPSKEEARAWIESMSSNPSIEIDDNNAGGLTVRWRPTNDEVIVIAYAIQIPQG